jgi:hypothetical protein
MRYAIIICGSLLLFGAPALVDGLWSALTGTRQGLDLTPPSKIPYEPYPSGGAL